MMAVISPRNFLYVLTLSLASRLIILAIQVIANVIIPEHDADAYRNRYHQTFEANQTLVNLLPQSYRYTYHFLQGLTKWDGQYFLEISNDGYTTEQHLAFLPFYPITISFFKQTIFDHSNLDFNHLISASRYSVERDISVKVLQDYVRSCMVAVAVNNFLFFPIACVSLFCLTKIVRSHSDLQTRDVVWWFCFNPASVFFSGCYSESLFAATTFLAMFVVEYRAKNYLNNYPSQPKTGIREPLSHLNRLVYVCLPSLVPFALAGATRSNGLVNIGFILYQALLKYLPVIRMENSHQSIVYYVLMCLEVIQDALVLVMSCVVAAAGYVTFQLYSYIQFCVKQNKEKGAVHIKPEWCYNTIPHPYGHVQAKYWNVGLFRYYQVKQLPNFLLAAPMMGLVLLGSLKLSNTSGKKEQTAYYIQAIFLTILCGLSINVQVLTRLLASSCPVVYWICSDAAKTSKTRQRLLIFYFSAYFIVGTVLHSNFYPWT